MSRVTNIILSVETLDIIEDQQVLLINEYFENKEIRGFVSMEDPMLPKRWYGGSKFLEPVHQMMSAQLPWDR